MISLLLTPGLQSSVVPSDTHPNEVSIIYKYPAHTQASGMDVALMSIADLRMELASLGEPLAEAVKVPLATLRTMVTDVRAARKAKEATT
jgi:hypothetical protein